MKYNIRQYLLGLAHTLQADNGLWCARRTTFQNNTIIAERGERMSNVSQAFSIALSHTSRIIVQMVNRRYRGQCRIMHNIAERDFPYANKRQFSKKSQWVGPYNRILLQLFWPCNKHIPPWITNRSYFESATKLWQLGNIKSLGYLLTTFNTLSLTQSSTLKESIMNISTKSSKMMM